MWIRSSYFTWSYKIMKLFDDIYKYIYIKILNYWTWTCNWHLESCFFISRWSINHATDYSISLLLPNLVSLTWRDIFFSNYLLNSCAPVLKFFSHFNYTLDITERSVWSYFISLFYRCLIYLSNLILFISLNCKFYTDVDKFCFFF